MRPRLPLILTAFALGILTTIAVAWWISWHVVVKDDTIYNGVQRIHNSYAYVWLNSRAGKSAYDWMATSEANARTWLDDPPQPFLRAVEITSGPPSWSTIRDQKLYNEAAAYSDGPMGCRIDYATGWPCHALACTLPSPEGYGLPLVDGIFGPYRSRPARSGHGWVSERAFLPFRPIWPGFLANTTLYSLAWFPIVLIPGLIRQTLRRRAGKCPTCAYPRLGLAPHTPCPECGSPARTPRPVATSS